MDMVENNFLELGLYNRTRWLSGTEAKQGCCTSGSDLAFRQILEVIFNQTLKVISEENFTQSG
jgi:hypothetical protein